MSIKDIMGHVHILSGRSLWSTATIQDSCAPENRTGTDDDRADHAEKEGVLEKAEEIRAPF